MNKEITGKHIAHIEAKQPKNLNMPIPKFVKTSKGKTVNEVTSKGKWIFIKLVRLRPPHPRKILNQT